MGHTKITRPKKSPEFLLYLDLYSIIDLPGVLVRKTHETCSINRAGKTRHRD